MARNLFDGIFRQACGSAHGKVRMCLVVWEAYAVAHYAYLFAVGGECFAQLFGCFVGFLLGAEVSDFETPVRGGVAYVGLILREPCRYDPLLG